MNTVSTNEVENHAPKKNHKVLLWIIVAVLAVVIGVFGYFVISDLHKEDLLEAEIQKVMDKDISQDDFTLDIKTSGDYAIVERAIKGYFKDISDHVKVINKLEEDESFLNILTPENFQEDGPAFEKTLVKINEIRTEASTSLNRLSEMCSEEYIMSIIEKYNLDKYYVDVYKRLMYSEDDLKEIQEARDEMISVGEKFDIFLDDCENIIQFLKKNSGNWVIESGSIVFRTDELLAEYTTLTEKLVEDSEF